MEDKEKANAKVICYIIKNSFVGELPLVFEDLKTITGKDITINPEIAKAVKEYYEAHSYPLNLAKSKCIISLKNREYGEGIENMYFDPDQRLVFKVNFKDLTTEIVKEIPLTEGDTIEPIRSLLSQELKKVLPSIFKEPSVLVLAVIKGLMYMLDVTISTHSVNLKNKWSGEWISSWQFKWEKGSNSGELTGDINIKGHFYEEGNIQRKVSQKVGSQEIKLADNLAILVCNCIVGVDGKIKSTMSQMEGEFSEALLKKIRRKLPGKDIIQ